MKAEMYAAELLRTIGMSPKYKGYVYLLYILSLTIEDATRMHNVSGKLYTMVCQKYRVEPYIVERNIRFAIRRTWEAQNSEKIRRLFMSYDIDYVPTNREFICIMTDYACHKTFFPVPLRMCG